MLSSSSHAVVVFSFFFSFCHPVLLPRHISFSRGSLPLKTGYPDVSTGPQLWSPSPGSSRV